MTENTKHCTTCKEVKPHSDFSKNRGTKDGLQSWCNACRSAYGKSDKAKETARAYREANRERMNAVKRAWSKANTDKTKATARRSYLKNREKILERVKKYAADPANKERIAAHAKAYHEANKEAIHEKKRIYYAANAEREKLRSKEWYEANKEMAMATNKTYVDNLPAAVYQIRNSLTGRIYVGQTTAYPRRWREHKSRLNTSSHQCPEIQQDYNEHGFDIFEFSVIQEYPSDTPSEILLEHEGRVVAAFISEGQELYNDRYHIDGYRHSKTKQLKA